MWQVTLQRFRNFVSDTTVSWGELEDPQPWDPPDAEAWGHEKGEPHRVPGAAHWPWLPTERTGTLSRHPYCADCGLVSSVGSDRALDLGGLANLLGRLGRALRDGGLKLTEAQRRLILKALQAEGADDRFGLSRTHQERLFAQSVAATLGVHQNVIHTYLRSI